ncbi:MAG: aminotransferase class I/II-fold pyridoxal phosphate-dependent enzyme [Myxococcales bacterium]|nr:aminotransferase class I/II-fold pyridoxal phosphate-dependent enzyme [Myxococcales bacterium]
MSSFLPPPKPRPREAAVHAAGPSTRSVHAGVGRPERFDAVPTPIVTTSTYTFADSSELAAHMTGEHADPHREEYGRYGNPTVRALEQRLAALEDPTGKAECAAFGSGMAALTTTLLALLKQGAHVILFRDGYRRTRQFVVKTLAAYGVEHTIVEPGDLAAVEAAIRPETRLVVGESPTNPYLHCTDLAALAALAKARRIKTVVDSTFATPIDLQPLGLGIDLVVHSATKYLAGHHDVLAGAVVGSRALVGLIRDLRGVLGGVLDPHGAFLVARGLKTLAVRVERHDRTAMAVAEMLATHPRVAEVFYPGLVSHPTYAIAQAQMNGFGGVVSFRVKTDPHGQGHDSPLAVTSRVVDGFQLARIAPSLGGVDTLVEQPAIMSYYEMTPEQRAAAGISDDLIRLAVGIEDEADVLADVQRALEAQ